MNEGFVKWLVLIGYPFEMQFTPQPPVSAEELAEAWATHTNDSTTVEEWLCGIHMEGHE